MRFSTNTASQIYLGTSRHNYKEDQVPRHVGLQPEFTKEFLSSDLRQAGRIFREWAQLPITHEEYLSKLKVLQRKYFPTAQPLPGVQELLHGLRVSNPSIHLALATSSHRDSFDLTTGHLNGMLSVFKEEHRILGDDPRIPLGRGKPAQTFTYSPCRPSTKASKLLVNQKFIRRNAWCLKIQCLVSKLVGELECK